MGTFDNSTEANENQVASDFDFDCEGGVVDGCAVYASLFEVDSPSSFGVNIIQQRRFTVLPTSVSYVSPAWEVDTSARAQSVIGVSRALSGWAAGRVYRAGGRRLTSGTDTGSTRLVEYPSLTSQTPSATLTHKGDDGVCLTYVTPEGAVGAATTHGGYSIAYCPSCNGGNGTLQSVHLMPEDDGSAECY